MSGDIKKFQKTVWAFFHANGRDLPWRRTTDPYAILVSEVMLQQTQVERVIPKYALFLKRFRTFRTLARAPVADVLKVWQGLGYNRRALMLKRAAETVVREYAGRLPDNFEQLQTLPGIGYYTAGAVMAFAFNMPVAIIETNIRRVFIHHFFSKQKTVHDKEILPFVLQSLPARRARLWYWALMDYGAYVAKHVSNPNRKSRHYARQSKFEGSHRQLRGQVLQFILTVQNTKPHAMARVLKKSIREIQSIMTELASEGLI